MMKIAISMTVVGGREQECEANPSKCARIARAATRYVQWFADKQRTMALAGERLRLYLDNVKIETVDG
jgi:hypothetical protein